MISLPFNSLLYPSLSCVQRRGRITFAALKQTQQMTEQLVLLDYFLDEKELCEYIRVTQNEKYPRTSLGPLLEQPVNELWKLKGMRARIFCWRNYANFADGGGGNFDRAEAAGSRLRQQPSLRRAAMSQKSRNFPYCHARPGSEETRCIRRHSGRPLDIVP